MEAGAPGQSGGDGGGAAVNTMDLENTFSQLAGQKKSEEVDLEFVEQADIRLVLFPSQIHKITALLNLLSYYRDYMIR